MTAEKDQAYMATDKFNQYSVGWIGAGRMGYSMASRLLQAGCKMAVYNRTRSKAEPLAEYGAEIVDSPTDLAKRDIVFTIVAGPEDLKEVAFGPYGFLSHADAAPNIIVDLTSVNGEASAAVRQAGKERGASMLAAPVSGNAKVVKAGKLSFVVSGPREAYDTMLPYLLAIGQGASYVGEGELSRMVKICHNVLLGVVAQSLAEITILAEKGGVPRHAFLDFINKSVMGSMFTRYKTPAFVNLDFTPTFTPSLLRKDLDLGLQAARELGVPLPTAAIVRETLQTLIGHGYTDCDFAALLELEAKASGLEIKPENIEVSDGL